MRYAMFSLENDPAPRLGVVHGSRITGVQGLLAGRWSGPAPATLLELIEAGADAWTRIEVVLNDALAGGGRPAYPADAVRWHAPIPRPRKNVMCLGLNYMSHVTESSQARGRQPKMPEVPVFFTKSPTAVNGPFDAIPWDPRATEQVDYEAELAVIIGVTGRNITREQSLRHVFGYTIVNDVTARDIQMKHLQWFKGKSLDGFCPMGPMVVTADEFGDPQKKRITLRLNGETRQDATTADMIFPVDVIIEALSRGMTLEAGDIISTGTPEGVGLGRTPPEYMKDGDVFETEIEGIGVMKNKIVKV